MTRDDEIRREYEFAMAHLTRGWLEMCSEYQNAYQQFPSSWTREERYWFARAQSAVMQHGRSETPTPPEEIEMFTKNQLAATEAVRDAQCYPDEPQSVEGHQTCFIVYESESQTFAIRDNGEETRTKSGEIAVDVIVFNLEQEQAER